MCMSCLSGLCAVCPVCLVCVLCVLFVWSGCYMSCLSGLPFFPSYTSCMYIAGVLYTCITMYVDSMYP